MRELAVRNGQRKQRIRIELVRQITRHLLERFLQLQNYELGVTFVSPEKMARINNDFLAHEGSTDVISFNYREGYEHEEKSDLKGEIFISPEDARRQAREFRTSWQEELVRYLVHGVLHLQGYDDLTTQKRKVMKREEGKLLRKLSREFRFRQLAG